MIRDFTEETLNDLITVTEGSLDDYFSSDGESFSDKLNYSKTVAGENCVIDISSLQEDMDWCRICGVDVEFAIEGYCQKLERIFADVRERDTQSISSVDSIINEAYEPYINSLNQLISAIDVSALGDTKELFNYNKGRYHSNFSNSVFGDVDSFAEKMDKIEGGVSDQLYNHLSKFSEDSEIEKELKELLNKPVGELNNWEIDVILKLSTENDLSSYYDLDEFSLDEWLKELFGKSYELSKSILEIIVDLLNLPDEYIDEFKGKSLSERLALLKKLIPQYASDSTVLDVFDLLSINMPIATLMFLLDHSDSNSEAWDKLLNDSESKICHSFGGKKYIELQEKLKDLEYGGFSADKNACEIIAFLNAMINKGKASVEDLPSTISLFEAYGPTLFGEFGTSPNTIVDVFEDAGVKADIYTSNEFESNKEKISKRYDTFVVTVYNNENDIMSEVHTMCITKNTNTGQYILHNAYNGSTTQTGYYTGNSIDEVLKQYSGGDSKLISIIGVN